MNKQEICDYMRKISRSGIRPGLERMDELMDRLGRPQDKIPVIHVAGTNGKGSVSAYMVSVLSRVLDSVGWYSSPAVIDERETIRIVVRDSDDLWGKSTYVSASVYEESMSAVIRVSKQMEAEGREHPTVFEMETAGAFLCFVSEAVDVAVVEVGMGGRGDATNVMNKTLLSLITPISIDHSAFLGDSLMEIAGEKAGIIRKYGDVVTYQPSVFLDEGSCLDIIREECDKKHASLTVVKKEDVLIEKMTMEGTAFVYKNEQFHTKMAGMYQPYNAALAIEAIHVLQKNIHYAILANINHEQILTGIGKAVWPGRMEILDHDPVTVYDGAHNPAGAKALALSLKSIFPEGTRMHGIMGVYRDKDIAGILESLLPCFSSLTTVTAPGSRGLEAEALGELAKEVLYEQYDDRNRIPIRIGKDVTCEVGRVRETVKRGDVIVVFGSLSLRKDLRNSSLCDNMYKLKN